MVRCGVTTFCAPPTVWRMLIQEDLASWKVKLTEAIGAGEPLNPEVIERVRTAWGLTIRDGYGQTETTAQVGNSPGQKVKAGSMGRPLPGYVVKITDADGNPAQEGEITIVLGETRPAGLMQGYQGEGGKLSGADGAIYRSGDVAFAEHYGIAYHRMPAGEDGLEKDWIATIRYIDRFERRNGEWRIAHRRSLVDSDRIDPVHESLIPRGGPMSGTRDRTDPSYER